MRGSSLWIANHVEKFNFARLRELLRKKKFRSKVARDIFSPSFFRIPDPCSRNTLTINVIGR